VLNRIIPKLAASAKATMMEAVYFTGLQETAASMLRDPLALAFANKLKRLGGNLSSVWPQGKHRHPAQPLIRDALRSGFPVRCSHTRSGARRALRSARVRRL
jgi:hypothetical protein